MQAIIHVTLFTVNSYDAVFRDGMPSASFISRENREAF